MSKDVPVVVVTAITQKDNKYLINKRFATSKREAGKCEFPGEKLDFLTDAENCSLICSSLG